MEAKLVSVKDFMMNSTATFYVPVFQRSYSWKENNINLLMDEIAQVFAGTKDMIFLGNAILSTKQNSDVFEIIDGQQRTITLFLITLAARNILLDLGTVHSKWGADMIDGFLQNTKTWDKPNAIIGFKLKAKNADESSLKSLFDSEGKDLEKLSENRINDNYKLIEQKLWTIYKTINDPNEFFDAFFNVFTRGIQMVRIVISDSDPINPQDVFESINGTGVPLTNLDLIRNYILMGNNEQLQQQLWDKEWEPFEIKLNKATNNDNSEIDKFLIKFIKDKTHKEVSSKDVYENMKELIDSSKDKKTFIEELNKEI